MGGQEREGWDTRVKEALALCALARTGSQPRTEMGGGVCKCSRESSKPMSHCCMRRHSVSWSPDLLPVPMSRSDFREG